jgi:hypothetical protein
MLPTWPVGKMRVKAELPAQHVVMSRPIGNFLGISEAGGIAHI